MPKMWGTRAIVLAAVLCVACGGRPGNTRQARQDGTVGTSGRAEDGAIAVNPAAEPPLFVSRDREGARLWTLTRQFYQKRGDTAAWIDGRKPRPQMDDVYLGYWTARVSADGILQFRDDLYRIDARQSTMLAGALETLKTRAAAAGAAAEAQAATPSRGKKG